MPEDTFSRDVAQIQSVFIVNTVMILNGVPSKDFDQNQTAQKHRR